MIFINNDTKKKKSLGELDSGGSSSENMAQPALSEVLTNHVLNKSSYRQRKLNSHLYEML